MKSILKPTEVFDSAIWSAKQKVKNAILKVAGVVEDERAFKSARAGFQIGIYLKSRQDALKVLAVAVANNMDCGGPSKAFSGDHYEVYVNINTPYNQ